MSIDGRWASELELALSASWAAGQYLMRSFRSELEVRHKGPDQPVTEADLGADALLKERLASADEFTGWLSEETVDRPDRLGLDRVWVVDPLDGTRSFVGGYPEFAVSVALVEGGAPVVGVIYNPAASDVFWAVRGSGAHRVRPWAGGPGWSERLVIPRPGPGRRRSVLASRTEIRRGEFEPLGGRWSVEPVGSTAYKLALVAVGGGDAFLSRGPKSEWDVAAGVLVLEEAGGVVTDLNGARLRFNRPDPYVHGVVAAQPAVHRELLDLVARLPSPRLRAGGKDGADGEQEDGR